MDPMFFPHPDDFRDWLKKNHDKATELWVGYYKKASGKPSITWSESVDQALCFGWIDGLRKSVDDISYKIRFTPRRPTSTWSAVNIKKIKELTKAGLMYPAGISAWEKRKKEKSKIYSFEQKNITLTKEYEKQLRTNKKAWAFFENLAPSYKKATIWWLMSAKKENTRSGRLQTLIKCSENGEKIPPLTPKSKNN